MASEPFVVVAGQSGDEWEFVPTTASCMQNSKASDKKFSTPPPPSSAAEAPIPNELMSPVVPFDPRSPRIFLSAQPPTVASHVPLPAPEPNGAAGGAPAVTAAGPTPNSAKVLATKFRGKYGSDAAVTPDVVASDCKSAIAERITHSPVPPKAPVLATRKLGKPLSSSSLAPIEVVTTATSTISTAEAAAAAVMRAVAAASADARCHHCGSYSSAQDMTSVADSANYVLCVLCFEQLRCVVCDKHDSTIRNTDGVFKCNTCV